MVNWDIIKQLALAMGILVVFLIAGWAVICWVNQIWPENKEDK